MDRSKGSQSANWELVLQEQRSHSTVRRRQEPNQRVVTENTSGTLTFRALLWAALRAGLYIVFFFHQSFLQHRVMTSLFLVWLLEDWCMAWKAATHGAQKHFSSCLGICCYMTPDPAPLKDFLHSWTLPRGLHSPTPTPLRLSSLSVPLLGTTLCYLEGRSSLHVPE